MSDLYTSGGDEFFPLDPDIINMGDTPEITEAGSRVGSYLKNVIKSVAGVSVEIAKNYTPDVVDFTSDLKETSVSISARAVEIKNKIFSRRMGDSKTVIDKLKKKGVETAKELKDNFKAALKTGKFGPAHDDSNPFAMFDTDFYDTTEGSSDSLSEPTPEDRASTATLQSTEATIDTTIQSTEAQMEQQEAIFKKTTLATNQRHQQQMTLLMNISSNITKMTAFNSELVQKDIASNLEFKAKNLAIMQDQLALLKEIKGASLLPTADKQKEESMFSTGGTRARDIFGSGIDSDAWSKRISSNVKSYLSNTALGQAVNMFGMMKSMQGMGPQQSLAKKIPMSIMNAVPALMMTGETRLNLDRFNSMFSGMGATMNAKFNQMQQSGSRIGRLVGTVLGARDVIAKRAKTGLDDPDAQVAFSAKDSRSITQVIPSLLSKIYSAVSGQEEIIYDYGKGRFTTASHVKRMFENRRDLHYDSDMSLRMAKGTLQKAAGNFLDQTTSDPTEVKKDIERIIRNASDSPLGLNINMINADPSYTKSLLNGVKNVENLQVFKDSFTTGLTNEEQVRMTQGLRTLHMQTERFYKQESNNLNATSNSQIVADEILQEELDMVQSQAGITADPTRFQRGTAEYRQALNKRQQLRMQEMELRSPVKTSGSISAIGSVGTEMDEANTGMTSWLSKIYNVLVDGIVVYPMKSSGIPSHIMERIKSRDQKLNIELDEKAMRDEQELEQSQQILSGSREMQYASLAVRHGNIGTKGMQQLQQQFSNNFVNPLLNVFSEGLRNFIVGDVGSRETSQGSSEDSLYREAVRSGQEANQELFKEGKQFFGKMSESGPIQGFKSALGQVGKSTRDASQSVRSGIDSAKSLIGSKMKDTSDRFKQTRFGQLTSTVGGKFRATYDSASSTIKNQFNDLQTRIDQSFERLPPQVQARFNQIKESDDSSIKNKIAEYQSIVSNYLVKAKDKSYDFTQRAIMNRFPGAKTDEEMRQSFMDQGMISNRSDVPKYDPKAGLLTSDSIMKPKRQFFGLGKVRAAYNTKDEFKEKTAEKLASTIGNSIKSNMKMDNISETIGKSMIQSFKPMTDQLNQTLNRITEQFESISESFSNDDILKRMDEIFRVSVEGMSDDMISLLNSLSFNSVEDYSNNAEIQQKKKKGLLGRLVGGTTKLTGGTLKLGGKLASGGIRRALKGVRGVAGISGSLLGSTGLFARSIASKLFSKKKKKSGNTPVDEQFSDEYVDDNAPTQRKRGAVGRLLGLTGSLAGGALKLGGKSIPAGLRTTGKVLGGAKRILFGRKDKDGTRKKGLIGGTLGLVNRLNPLKKKIREGSYRDYLRDEKAEDENEWKEKLLNEVIAIRKAIKGRRSSNDDDENDDDGKKKKKRGRGLLKAGLATAGLAAGAGALAKGLFNQARRGRDIQQRGGRFSDQISSILGIGGSGDYDFDGSEMTDSARAGDNFKTGRLAGVIGVESITRKAGKGTQTFQGKIAKKLWKAGPKQIGQLTKNGLSQAKTMAQNVLKQPKALAQKGLSSAKSLVKSPQKILGTLKKGLNQVFASGKIGKMIGKKAGSELTEKFVKNLSQKGLKSVLPKLGAKITSSFSPIGIGMLAGDFAAGMTNARRYFGLPKGIKPNIGMRLTSGLSQLLSGFTFGLIPADKLTEMIYNVIGDESDNIAIDRAKVFGDKRAKILSVGPDRLQQYESKTVGERIFGGARNLFGDRDKKKWAGVLGFGNDDAGLAKYRSWEERAYQPLNDIFESLKNQYQDQYGVDVTSMNLATGDEIALQDQFRNDFLVQAKNYADSNNLNDILKEAESETRSDPTGTIPEENAGSEKTQVQSVPAISTVPTIETATSQSGASAQVAMGQTSGSLKTSASITSSTTPGKQLANAAALTQIAQKSESQKASLKQSPIANDIQNTNAFVMNELDTLRSMYKEDLRHHKIVEQLLNAITSIMSSNQSGSNPMANMLNTIPIVETSPSQVSDWNSRSVIAKGA